MRQEFLSSRSPRLRLSPSPPEKLRYNSLINSRIRSPPEILRRYRLINSRIRIIRNKLTLINELSFQNEGLKIHDELHIELIYRSILFIVLWQLKYLMSVEL